MAGKISSAWWTAIAFLGSFLLGSFYVWLSQPRLQTFEEGVSELASRDPKIGREIMLVESMKASHPNRFLILLLGGCTGCSVIGGRLKQLDLSRWPSVVAVSSAESIDEAALPSQIVTLELTNDTYYHQALNAYWAPRLAVLDSAGRLTALQERDEEPSAFLRRTQ